VSARSRLQHALDHWRSGGSGSSAVPPSSFSGSTLLPLASLNVVRLPVLPRRATGRAFAGDEARATSRGTTHAPPPPPMIERRATRAHDRSACDDARLDARCCTPFCRSFSSICSSWR